MPADRTSQKYLILGGGISGLALAWQLQKKNSVILLEREDRCGGWIQTDRSQGFIFEQGPRSCRPKGSGIYTLKLIEELGLQNEVILGSAKAKKRYLYYKEKLRRVPTSIQLLPSLITGCCRDLLTSSRGIEDESIDSFFSRRFGKKFASKFIDPMVKGIWAGDSTQLSMQSCFPAIYEWEQQYGSVIKGALKKGKVEEQLSPWIQQLQKEPLFTFRNGMQTLTDTLYQKLQANIRLNCSAETIQFKNGAVEVTTSQGNLLKADHLFSTIPPHALAELLPYPFEAIPSLSITCVNLGYKKSLLKKEGFGYLIPSSEKEDILGVVWDSSAFPEQNLYKEETRFSVMISDIIPDALEIALAAIERHLNIREKPDSYKVTHTKNAIPQYCIGHKKWVEKLILSTKEHPLTILGNGFYGVSVNDCIKYSTNHSK